MCIVKIGYITRMYKVRIRYITRMYKPGKIKLYDTSPGCIKLKLDTPPGCTKLNMTLHQDVYS